MICTLTIFSRDSGTGWAGAQAPEGPLDLGGVRGGRRGQVPGEPHMPGIHPIRQGQGDDQGRAGCEHRQQPSGPPSGCWCAGKYCVTPALAARYISRPSPRPMTKAFTAAASCSQSQVAACIHGSRPGGTVTCVVGTRGWPAKQDHPAYIPRVLRPVRGPALRPRGLGCSLAGPRRSVHALAPQ